MIMRSNLSMSVHAAGGKGGIASRKAAVIKAAWQAEIRAYTAHLHLTDGKVDMSEDLGCAAAHLLDLKSHQQGWCLQ